MPDRIPFDLSAYGTRPAALPEARVPVLLGGVPRGDPRPARRRPFRVVKMPIPEWSKPILVPAEKVGANGAASPRETDIPEDAQDEIRALAAAEEAETMGLEAPEDIRVEDLDAEEEASEAGTEAPDESPPEPPKPSRAPGRFEFVAKAGSLRTFLAQVAHLVDEAKIVATREAWHVLAVDPAHVALIDVRLEGIDAFESRDGKHLPVADDVAFGADVEKLLALAKKARKDDAIRLTADLPNPADKDELTLEVGALRRTMAAINTLGMSDPRIPTLSLPATIEVHAAALLEAARACEDVSDHVRLTATRDGLNVFGEGDVDTVSMDLRQGDEAFVEIGGPEDRYTSLFPLDYLVAFLKVVKDEPKVVLRLGTNYPVRVDWDGATRGTYLLAPRIEE